LTNAELEFITKRPKDKLWIEIDHWGILFYFDLDDWLFVHRNSYNSCALYFHQLDSGLKQREEKCREYRR
jgi:hypothetical protein